MTANKIGMKSSIAACRKCGSRQQCSDGERTGEGGHASLPPQSASSVGTEQLLLPNALTPVSLIACADSVERGHKPSWRMPWFLTVMSCVQLSVYFIANGCLTRRLMLIPAHPYEVWRYFTYTLLHSDLMHLLLNVSLQCLIGFCLESEQSHLQVAFIYVAGGLCGSLVTAYSQPELSLLGASACVYALLTSHVPHLVLNFRQLPYRYLRIASLLILCLTDVTLTAYHFLVKHNVNPRICVEAHIAGALSGLSFGFLLYSVMRRHYASHCCLLSI
ncbi:PREDICTED: rhomboid-related protein 2 [Bactrocera latifrons]|uniref:rhomboid-related protein 2 n=1 Tax=Bactrocera latifrons TaxID=174628 RepID=UPI0008DE3D59|nr:PREDICTED: rhomboid-related protein 2 [Bactrocera latifrons]